MSSGLMQLQIFEQEGGAFCCCLGIAFHYVTAQRIAAYVAQMVDATNL